MDKPRMDLSIPDPKVIAKIMDEDTTHVLLEFIEYPNGYAQGRITRAGSEEECEEAREWASTQIQIVFHGGTPCASVDEVEEYRRLLSV